MPKRADSVYSTDLPKLWLERLTGAGRAHALDFIDCKIGPAAAKDKRYVLPVTIRFSHQQRWIIKRQRLSSHPVLDLTPKGFDEAEERAERAYERASEAANEARDDYYDALGEDDPKVVAAGRRMDRADHAAAEQLSNIPERDPNWRLEIGEFLEQPTVRLSFATMKEALDYEEKLNHALSPLRDFIERCSPNRKETKWKRL